MHDYSENITRIHKIGMINVNKWGLKHKLFLKTFK